MQGKAYNEVPIQFLAALYSAGTDLSSFSSAIHADNSLKSFYGVGRRGHLSWQTIHSVRYEARITFCGSIKRRRKKMSRKGMLNRIYYRNLSSYTSMMPSIVGMVRYAISSDNYPMNTPNRNLAEIRSRVCI